ncbi:MAG: DNA repair protein RecO [Flavobacteriales bacterium]
MTEDNIIVLHKFPYRNGFIVEVFSEEHGKISFVLKSRKSKKNPIGNFHTLSLLSCQYLWKESSDLQNITSSNPISLDHHFEVDPEKMFIQFFFADFLRQILLKKVPSKRLFIFAQHIITFINETNYNELKDLPCYILYKSANILGINIICDSNKYLDLTSGYQSINQTSGSFTLFPKHSEYLNNIEGMVFADKKTYISDYKTRSETFELLYRYFRYHLNHFETLKSYTVLKQIML